MVLAGLVRGPVLTDLKLGMTHNVVGDVAFGFGQ